MHTENMKKQFTTFLIENDAIERFKYHIRRVHNVALEDYLLRFVTEPARFIFSAFSWSGTQEGNEYWNHLHRKWKAIVLNATISNYKPKKQYNSVW